MNRPCSAAKILAEIVSDPRIVEFAEKHRVCIVVIDIDADTTGDKLGLVVAKVGPCDNAVASLGLIPVRYARLVQVYYLVLPEVFEENIMQEFVKQVRSVVQTRPELKHYRFEFRRIEKLRAREESLRKCFTEVVVKSLGGGLALP